MTRIIHFADSHEEAVFPRGLDKRVLGYCKVDDPGHFFCSALMD